MASANELLIRGIELQNQARPQEAAEIFRQVLAMEPNNAPCLYSLGVILINSGQAAEALELVERGTQLAPQFAPMWCVRAMAMLGLGSKDEALKSYDKALEADPNNTLALLNSSAMLREMQRHHESLERSNRILTFDPNNEAALGNTGILLTEFKRSKEAVAMFERLLQINPNFEYGLGLMVYEQMHICNWLNMQSITSKILEGIGKGQRTCKTLALMSLTDSVAQHFLAARIFGQHRFPKHPISLWRGERYNHEKLRIAYLSPDLREHPVGHLMAGIFEQHDKSRFEITALSLGTNDNSRIRQRMEAAFDHFIDVKDLTSLAIAELVRKMEIDIVVDLAGYTADSRTDVMSFRPAPVHVNFLGYPGTLGVDFVDFILADRHVIPPEHEPFYSEKVMCLPDNYLPTASGIKISERTPSRAECGLPEEGFVFCSFSHDYKVSPPVFDVWMRLLANNPGSVLWLMSRNEESQQNLRTAAEARGVAGSRLIFAGRVPLVEDHLARYRQADLFLDTHPYNAHTTSADALMAGLPVLTYMGNAFPARVAGSLLHAVGLPELATHSLADYEALAMQLAGNKDQLLALKEKLKANQATHPLCNPETFCRNLETAFEKMQQICVSGGLPHTACLR